MKSTTFCVLPYYAYESAGQNTRNIYCCRWPKNTNVGAVRQAIADGEQHPACNSCWRLESQGQTSERIIHNRTMDHLMNRNIEDICESALNDQGYIAMVKLQTSNLCNGTCITCGPESSTAWQTLNGRVNYQVLSIPDINWRTVAYLSFVGGEPLLEKKNWLILEQLIIEKNTDIFLTFVTNGSMELTERQIQILSEFKNINICISVDGIEQSFEYMRYPLKWDLFFANFVKFKQITSNISASVMVSNINIYYLDQIDAFLKNEHIPAMYKQIEDPAVYAPWNLPDDLKQIVIAENSAGLVDKFLNMESFDPKLWAGFKIKLTAQDELKKISIGSYLGDWGKYLL